MKRFWQFGGLSGVGWLLDFGLLMALVHAGVPANLGNFISASIAALGVFLISHHLVFDQGAGGGLTRRVLGYFLYTLAMITLASAAIGPVIGLAGQGAAALGLALDPQILAACAKIAITPPLLLANFCVARHLSQKDLKEPRHG